MQQKLKTIKYLALFGILFTLLAPDFALAFEAAPYASTMQPTFVTEKSIQLNGRVNPNGMSDTYEWFEWGISGRADIYETNHIRLRGGNSQINTSATVVGLAPSTQYFYRQVAENSRGKNIGNTTYITTKPLSSVTQPIALVVTNTAVFVGGTGATLRGYVSPHGVSSTKTWFEWGMTPTMEYQTPQGAKNGASGPIEAKLQGLMPGTLYYFRAVAENTQGRSYGVQQTFVTSGVSATVAGETPRGQNIPSPVNSSSDATAREVTTSAAVTASQGDTSQPDANSSLPQARNRPGDFFSMFFGGKNTDTAPEGNTGVNGNIDTTQVAGVAASGLLPGSGMLTGKKDVEVVVGKIGPANVIPHTPVEYRIAYAYRRTTPATDAKLRITLPGEVIYIGDNTNNELLLEAGSGSERTYILPLGKIAEGSTRTISILGMTTGDAKGFPDAIVELNYTDKSGTHVVGAGSGVLASNTPANTGTSATQNSASVASANTGIKILPTSLLGWMLYVLVVVAAIFGVRKAKVYYFKRKELLAKEDVERGAPAFLPGAQEITPQGA